jgi:hypothetical protein
VDLFTFNFLFFSALGAGAASKALGSADLPAAGRVCLGEAIATITINRVLAEGTDCLGMVPAVPIDGSTVMEGTSCSFTVSSLIVSSTLSLACFAFGELGLKNQKKEIIQSRSLTAGNKKHSEEQARHLPMCFIFITTRYSASFALLGGDPRPLRVTRQKVTTRRALALLGDLHFFAPHHIRQGAVVISGLIVLLVH